MRNANVKLLKVRSVPLSPWEEGLGVRVTLLLVFNLFWVNDMLCQKIECNTITADMNFTVNSVKIIGRWVPKELQQKVEQLIGVGQLFDPAKVGHAEELVRNEILESEGKFSIRLAGATSVLFITSDVCPVADSVSQKKVQVVIHPYYLRIDLYNAGNNILPIPRTAKPPFYKNVPSIILATAPYIGVMNDRSYGTFAFVKTSTDLLQIPFKKDKLTTKKLRLNFDVDFRKSFSYRYYNVLGLLQLAHPVYTDSSTGWNISFMYAKNVQPLNITDYSNDLTKFFASIQGNGKISFINKYLITAGVSFSQNNFISLNNKFKNPETDYELKAFCDGRITKGFTRLGLWFNAGVPKNNFNLKPYQRVAGKFGYSVSLGSGHNNVDLEAIAGVGYTWGTPPVYSEYFAGNVASNFLYAPLQSFNTMPPEGLVIRSLGEKQGGLPTILNTVSGGTSYWGVNINFSIPITKWSAPLIPDVVIQEEPRRLTIRSAIKGQVNTAKSFIANDLALNGGLSDDDADAAAERIVDKDIKPTINYLADRANIYSIKPILFFDAGQINKRGVGNRLWIASGAGLQINIVNAKLQLGYIQTLSPKADASKGNFLMSFSVQNFY